VALTGFRSLLTEKVLKKSWYCWTL